MALEIGRVCVKVAGKEAGGICVVVKNVDKNFVEVSGPKLLTGIKRRKVNVVHLDPTPYKLEISEGAADDAIIGAYDKAGVTKKYGLKKPSAAQMKSKPEEKKAEDSNEKPAKKESKKEKKEKK